MLTTHRLLLRTWRPEDAESFARLNADPFVMEHFPAPLTRSESDSLMQRINAHFNTHGWGLWAIEVPGTVPFIGFCGLLQVSFDAHFTPAIEIGWRLARPYWGQGYAFEAARAAMSCGFQTLNLPEIVSFTTPTNIRSWQLMQRLGMSRHPDDDFEHPLLPISHPLRLHHLYRIRKQTNSF